MLILKINTTLKDIGQKLFYFQSFLTNQSTINKEPYQESYQDSYLRSIKIETDVNQSQEDPYLNMENI